MCMCVACKAVALSFLHRLNWRSIFDCLCTVVCACDCVSVCVYPGACVFVCTPAHVCLCVPRGMCVCVYPGACAFVCTPAHVRLCVITDLETVTRVSAIPLMCAWPVFNLGR